jgi:hypothetical protein
MNWYRTLKADASGLSNTIATWLQQAAQGSVDMQLLQQDVAQFMGGADDATQLDDAIKEGEMIYRSKYKNTGELTPAQADVLNSVKMRVESPPDSSDQPISGAGDLGMGQMENVNV